MNAISKTHAEAEVLQKAKDTGGAEGRKATLFVDHPEGLCKSCHEKGAVKSMARQVGLSQLTVVAPNAEPYIIYP